VLVRLRRQREWKRELAVGVGLGLGLDHDAAANDRPSLPASDVLVLQLPGIDSAATTTAAADPLHYEERRDAAMRAEVGQQLLEMEQRYHYERQHPEEGTLLVQPIVHPCVSDAERHSERLQRWQDQVAAQAAAAAAAAAAATGGPEPSSSTRLPLLGLPTDGVQRPHVVEIGMSKASARLALERGEEAALLRQMHEAEMREHGHPPMNMPMTPSFQPGPTPCNPVSAMGVATRRKLVVLQGQGMNAADVITIEQRRRQYLNHLQHQAATTVAEGRPLDKAMVRELEIGLSAEDHEYRLALQQQYMEGEHEQHQHNDQLSSTAVHCILMEEELERGLQEQEELRWQQEHGRVSPPPRRL
jgi:hypothetical protein